MKSRNDDVLNLHEFATHKSITKSPIQLIIKHLIRETNKNKLNYDQLKYIFKEVRRRCDVKAPQPPKRLIDLPTTDELNSFYLSISNPIHRLIFEVLEGTGVRIAELCKLEVRHIDFKSNQIFIHEGKGKKDRIVIIGNIIKDKLEIYLQNRQNRYLFESSRHTKFSTRRIEQLCKLYKTKSKIDKKLTPHTFRHVFFTRLAEAGISKEKRALLAGHSNDKTQDIYCHLGVSGMKNEVVVILDNLLR